MTITRMSPQGQTRRKTVSPETPRLRRSTGREKIHVLVASAFVVAPFFVAYVGLPHMQAILYVAPGVHSESVQTTEAMKRDPSPDVLTVSHVPTPPALKALYMTQCVAGTPSFREKLFILVQETELNAVVIDVKDFSGGLGYPFSDPELARFLSTRCYAPDLPAFIARLHEANIYAIARISVFQDPLRAKEFPDTAVQRASDGSVWKDNKGLSFIDPGSAAYREYIVKLSKETYALGFDELNYDYIRFPSDGNMRDIHYPVSQSRINANPEQGKALVMRDFFAYLQHALKDTGALLSADLFGMTTTNPDDLNIGQLLEFTLPYFDYVAPMVYPSHYPKGFLNLGNPAAHPYEVVRFSMDAAVERAKQLDEYGVPTTTPSTIPTAACASCKKLRPWLQDFDLGADYTPEMVRAQIKATYDAGLTSWMLWDAGNTYTRGALEP